MADMQAVVDALTRLEYAVNTLPEKLRISASQVVIIGGLSDLSESLGLVMAGEFRAGNQRPPGDGFSGMRMGYPAMLYDNEEWNLVGVNNDAIQFGVKASDGKLYAGAGAVTLSEDGLKVIGEGSVDYYRRIRFIYEQGDTDYIMASLYADYGTPGGGQTVHIRAEATSDSPWTAYNLKLYSYLYPGVTQSELTLHSNGTAGIGGAVFSVDATSSIFLKAPNIAVDLATTTFSVEISGTIYIKAPEVKINNTLQLAETASPSTTLGGYGALYVKDDGNLYFCNDGGVEYQLTPTPST